MANNSETRTRELSLRNENKMAASHAFFIRMSVFRWTTYYSHTITGNALAQQRSIKMFDLHPPLNRSVCLWHE